MFTDITWLGYLIIFAWMAFAFVFGIWCYLIISDKHCTRDEAMWRPPR